MSSPASACRHSGIDHWQQIINTNSNKLVVKSPTNLFSLVKLLKSN